MKFIVRIKGHGFILFFIFISFFSLTARDAEEMKEFCYHPKIRTVLFFRSGWELSMPVILLNEEESLEFRFDYMGEPELDMSYAVANCTYDWQLNNMSEHYYLEGFNDVPLFDYQPSRNTNVYFTHYAANLPNDDLQITRSGNYVLRVFESSDPDSVILQRRFAIVDRRVEIMADIHRPDREHQELMMKIDLKNLRPTDPIEDIKVVIIKNYDWNNKVTIRSKPVLRDHVLHYDMPYQIITKGGNEFRHVDTKDPDFVAIGVDNIAYNSPYYCFYLLPEKLRQFSPYFSDRDLNGRSFYEIPDAQDRHLDADYVRVFFKLESMRPLGSEVYIYGALTNWKTDTSNYMIYNSEEGIYEAELTLKQGMLNYQYALRDYDSQTLDFDITEGNHAETENDYLIFVYYRGIMSDFDELVGYKVVNTNTP